MIKNNEYGCCVYAIIDDSTESFIVSLLYILPNCFPHEYESVIQMYYCDTYLFEYRARNVHCAYLPHICPRHVKTPFSQICIAFIRGLF